MDVKTQLEALFALQTIDSKLHYINELKSSLPDELKFIKSEITTCEKTIETTKKLIEEANLRITAEKKKIAEKNILLEKYRIQQNTTTVSREFAAISKEIDLYTLDLQISEKKIKTDTQNVEKNKESLQELENDLKQLNLDLEAKISEIEETTVSQAKIEEDLLKKREISAALINTKIITRYDRIRKTTKSGLAAVEVERGACGACFIFVPFQKRIDISNYETIQNCDYCGAFLVKASLTEDSQEKYPPTHTPPETAPVVEDIEL